MKEQQHYKTLFKATSLFGLVEVLRMILKVAANIGASHFLGIKGVGLLGLMENTIQLISSFAGFGINFTGVREIAVKKGGDKDEYQKTIKAISVFSLITGVVSGLISAVFCYYLSFLTFKTPSYYYWFIGLSVYFILTSYTQSRIIYLEGTQNFQKLLRINVLSNTVNTAVVLLSYFFFELQGIIIAVVINAVLNWVIYVKLSNMPRSKVRFASGELLKYFYSFIKSGSLLALNTFIGLLCFYVIRLYFNNTNADLLGYYHVGNIIIVSYLGLIFLAMGKYFFPKLSQSAANISESNELINNQLELSFLIILPAILIVYSLGHILIRILFSAEFMPVYNILVFGLGSIIFRGFNYAVGYLLLSHKNYRQYFYINAVSDLLNVVLTIFLYQKIGLYGVGLAILINYFLSSVYIYWYVNKKYYFKLSIQVKRLSIAVIIIVFGIISLYYTLTQPVFIIISGLMAVLTVLYSLKKIDEYILDFKFQKKIKSLF